MIKFAADFGDRDQDFLLLELPKSLRTKLQNEKVLSLRESEDGIYVVSQDHTFQLEKVDISNSMMIGEIKPEGTNNSLIENIIF